MLVNVGMLQFMSILVVEIVWDWFAQAINPCSITQPCMQRLLSA